MRPSRCRRRAHLASFFSTTACHAEGTAIPRTLGCQEGGPDRHRELARKDLPPVGPCCRALSGVLAHEQVALEEVDDGIWSVFFYNTLLGRLDERILRIVHTATAPSRGARRELRACSTVRATCLSGETTETTETETTETETTETAESVDSFVCLAPQRRTKESIVSNRDCYLCTRSEA
jgi:hypothetical protein